MYRPQFSYLCDRYLGQVTAAALGAARALFWRAIALILRRTSGTSRTWRRSTGGRVLDLFTRARPRAGPRYNDRRSGWRRNSPRSRRWSTPGCRRARPGTRRGRAGRGGSTGTYRGCCSAEITRRRAGRFRRRAGSTTTSRAPGDVGAVDKRSAAAPGPNSGWAAAPPVPEPPAHARTRVNDPNNRV